RSIASEQAFSRPNARNPRVESALRTAQAYERLFATSANGERIVRQIAELPGDLRSLMFDQLAREISSQSNPIEMSGIDRLLQAVKAVPETHRMPFADALLSGPRTGNSQTSDLMAAVMNGRVNPEQASSLFRISENHLNLLSEILARIPN